MTIEEFYKWAKENGYEKFEIRVYTEGLSTRGTDFGDWDIDIPRQEVTI